MFLYIPGVASRFYICVPTMLGWVLVLVVSTGYSYWAERLVWAAHGWGTSQYGPGLEERMIQQEYIYISIAQYDMSRIKL